MKKSHTIIIFILSILVTILVAGLLVFFLKIIENKNQHIFVVTETIGDKLKEKENVTMFTEKLSEIQLLENNIDSRFVDSNKIDTFVSYLEEIDLDIGSDISVKNIEISPKTKEVISFKILITGTFEQVMRTVVLLENIPYEVDIISIYLNKDLTETTNKEGEKTKILGVPTWQADISFNILSSN